MVPNAIVQSPSWSGWLVAACYAIAASIIWRRQLVREMANLVAAIRRSMPSTMPPRWAAAGVGLLAVVVWTGALSDGSSGELQITFFETNVGDSILIETPSGTPVLIDGGRSTLGAVRSLERRMPFSDPRLDLVIATHGDQDHIGGLEAVLERYEGEHVADPHTEPDTRVYSDWLESAASHPARPVLTGGELFALGDGISLEAISARPVCHGADDNDSSVVLLLLYGEIEILLLADLEAGGEAVLLGQRARVDVDVLLAGRHGSHTSSSPAFLNAVSPAAIVVSAGADNPYGRPHPDVFERLQAIVCETCLYRTDPHGDVAMRTDGRRTWVETDHWAASFVSPRRLDSTPTLGSVCRRTGADLR